jgi:hypothetical protein
VKYGKATRDQREKNSTPLSRTPVIRQEIHEERNKNYQLITKNASKGKNLPYCRY